MKIISGIASKVLDPAVIRNVLRYGSSALVTYGVISVDTAQAIQSDPVITAHVSAIAGIVIGGATEIAYVMARKLGWRT